MNKDTLQYIKYLQAYGPADMTLGDLVGADYKPLPPMPPIRPKGREEKPE